MEPRFSTSSRISQTFPRNGYGAGGLRKPKRVPQGGPRRDNAHAIDRGTAAVKSEARHAGSRADLLEDWSRSASAPVVSANPTFEELAIGASQLGS